MNEKESFRLLLLVLILCIMEPFVEIRKTREIHKNSAYNYAVVTENLWGTTNYSYTVGDKEYKNTARLDGMNIRDTILILYNRHKPL